MTNIIIISSISLMFLYSCMGVGMRSQKGSNSSIYEMYYIDSTTNQYFIKPLYFKNKEYSFQYDVVFRVPYKTKATLNFSLFTKENINKIDSFYVSNQQNDTKKVIYIKRLLYKEKKGNDYHYRYSSQISNELVNILFDNQVKFIFNFNKKDIVLLPTRKTKKKSNYIKENIIELLK